MMSPDSMDQYESILTKHNQSIEELARGKWLIKSGKKMVLHSLQNSTIRYKFYHSRVKRSRGYSKSSLSLIRSKNITAMYYNLEQVYEWIYFISEQYSDIVELIEIGKSIQNRSLLVLKIGYKSESNVTKKLFWYDAGIHAREWTTISAAMYTVDKIDRHLEVDDQFKISFQFKELIFVELFNI
ncbi:carboxypeptidase A6 [Brachionus plicatilis]|uniref:Carboxypeptidase A6 n=1 Tax=Brachionus plicatilis TaxID=10195 RepID=A0A3M7PAI4_BRAPC|nr:carboxypeptidase A6 [Brachionus plicatilis]